MNRKIKIEHYNVFNVTFDIYIFLSLLNKV